MPGTTAEEEACERGQVRGAAANQRGSSMARRGRGGKGAAARGGKGAAARGGKEAAARGGKEAAARGGKGGGRRAGVCAVPDDDGFASDDDDDEDEDDDDDEDEEEDHEDEEEDDEDEEEDDDDEEEDGEEGVLEGDVVAPDDTPFLFQANDVIYAAGVNRDEAHSAMLAALTGGGFGQAHLRGTLTLTPIQFTYCPLNGIPCPPIRLGELTLCPLFETITRTSAVWTVTLYRQGATTGEDRWDVFAFHEKDTQLLFQEAMKPLYRDNWCACTHMHMHTYMHAHTCTHAHTGKSCKSLQKRRLQVLCNCATPSVRSKRMLSGLLSGVLSRVSSKRRLLLGTSI